MSWYVKALKKYAEFNGRASRREYWVFTLLSGAIYIALKIFDSVIYLKSSFNPRISELYFVLVLLPSVAVTVRRLHDVGKEGMYALTFFVPILGFFFWLNYMLRYSDAGDNKYGSDPAAISN
ncbi:MAG TPA: DUF805 domain-containing protein [Anaerolineae bacterium]|nr:DUF805 domain-containing protein [Anaerolineae bacterium]